MKKQYKAAGKENMKQIVPHKLCKTASQSELAKLAGMARGAAGKL